MLEISKAKFEKIEKLSNTNQIIAALAIDQRGSLRKMISDNSTREIGTEDIEEFKSLVSKKLTPYASSILLDPEYGLPAAKAKESECGLILAYEKTGYDSTSEERLPDLLPEWSVKRIVNHKADAVKILLYYDVDADETINDYKKAFVERVGSECEAEDIPFFLEIVTYDAQNKDVKGKEYAKVKPHKVNQAMKEFSDVTYKVDVLKVEVPVNIYYVEGFAEVGEEVYSEQEALQFFKEQSESTHLPFIFLSAGVSARLFQETLLFAKKAESTFNGVLCGRATWKESVNIFATKGSEEAMKWLETEGRNNIEELNKVLEKSAKPWTSKVKIKKMLHSVKD